VIAAAVVWYDEPIESLERCLRSLIPVADLLVIADGRWELFGDGGHPDVPDLPTKSPIEQRALVKRLAQDFRYDLIIDTVDPWESQVAKRSTIYNLASTAAEWTLVIDADEHVEHCEPAALRAALSATDCLTARVASRTVRGPSAGPGIALQPRLFSNADGPLTVESSHNGIRSAGGAWLAGDPAYVPVVESVDVSARLMLYHEQGVNRPRERELHDRRYRARRRQRNVEGWPRRRNRA
jgi:hypothetical protein